MNTNPEMTMNATKTPTAIRTLTEAREILRTAGLAEDAEWYGEDDASEDLLGCTLDQHREWLCSAPADDVRSWARSVREEE